MTIVNNIDICISVISREIIKKNIYIFWRRNIHKIIILSVASLFNVKSNNIISLNYPIFTIIDMCLHA